MIYVEGFLRNDYQFKECPNCSNEEFEHEAQYCKICGKYVRNLCEGQEVPFGERKQHVCPGNARFCEECGSRTQFFIDGFLKPWEEAKAIIEGRSKPLNVLAGDTIDDDDLPF